MVESRPTRRPWCFDIERHLRALQRRGPGLAKDRTEEDSCQQHVHVVQHSLGALKYREGRKAGCVDSKPQQGESRMVPQVFGGHNALITVCRLKNGA